ncbi:hypothetical protein G7Y89_g10349 [Cudoniella acicularis]|uniref:Luciferase-like domain-containing protein n=1 Tax=Cudoniella acicularis TaxID=354080 RepID=A0A8H4RFQ6_9HELO|nr:hypothetical protein G7Y89_g10349 [Cudoniella acicularis]
MSNIAANNPETPQSTPISKPLENLTLHDEKPKTPLGPHGFTSDGSKKRILLNAFDMNGIGHTSVGQWQNPTDKSKTKNTLDYWINLAKLLEKGKFNTLFLADNFGSHDVYQESHAPAIKAGAQWPLYEREKIVSAMAAVTKSLGFGITSCTTFEPPFLLAKRFSTLDHLTRGRIAWNIVTSWSDSAARAMGLEALPEHDERYVIAEEYLQLIYKLWEGSWADDALVLDTNTSTFANPDKVRKIEHRGKYFKCVSAHQVDPSPQRTPLLFQAGMSPAGAAFGSKHAECIFIGGPNPAFVGEKIKKTRALAQSQGRNPSDLKFFISFTPVLGSTDEEAQAKLQEYLKYSILDGSLAKFCGISGIDLAKFGLDEEFPTDPEHPTLSHLSVKQREVLTNRPDGYESWTPRILGEWSAIGGSSPFQVGSGEMVADELERWIRIADVDGFNIGHVVVPQAWVDVIDFLIPVLEKRGWLGNSNEYSVPGGTLRENLYGTPGDSRLRASHPGSAFKFDVLQK